MGPGPKNAGAQGPRLKQEKPNTWPMDRLSTAGKEESGKNKHMADDDYLLLGELLHVDYLSKDDAYFLGTSAIM